MTIPRQEFRDAMARLGAAVNIITTGGPAGRGGFTASAVCSVTDEPPTLLLCMNRGATAAPAMKANGTVCVNVVAAAQKEAAMVFAGVTKCSMEERFDAGTWMTLATGAPVLQGAVASFDCRIAEIIEKGTHLVVFGEVQAIRLGDPNDHGLIYFGRDYHPVGMPAA
ncbi:flavin reductase [Paracraurococcus ruber]|uniref:4-hydroxyphenylacetate 3-monooxygenase n=1 Tax=Paracraurococcus ruber TaxID=77675 RepID=A0ABS1CZT1_9PROT|nr:flavin reductase [Paracraurococcus ruber]MBK1659840.1 4-hydroxyphenylacetate 3-monooxygenase [Paracraurococcus ruber]TDG32141.1 flavin reductase [Paracraurococcus ruber]